MTEEKKSVVHSADENVARLYTRARRQNVKQSDGGSRERRAFLKWCSGESNYPVEGWRWGGVGEAVSVGGARCGPFRVAFALIKRLGSLREKDVILATHRRRRERTTFKWESNCLRRRRRQRSSKSKQTQPDERRATGWFPGRLPPTPALSLESKNGHFPLASLEYAEGVAAALPASARRIQR